MTEILNLTESQENKIYNVHFEKNQVFVFVFFTFFYGNNQCNVLKNCKKVNVFEFKGL